MTPTGIVERRAHPRLATLIAVGTVLLVVGGVLAAADAYGWLATGLLGIRVGFVGFLPFVFGASGYLALAVFETHPER